MATINVSSGRTSSGTVTKDAKLHRLTDRGTWLDMTRELNG